MSAKPSKLAELIAAAPGRAAAQAPPSGPYGDSLLKVTLNLPAGLVGDLKALAVEENVTVGALVESLAALALDDATLQAHAVAGARRVSGRRRARK